MEPLLVAILILLIGLLIGVLAMVLLLVRRSPRETRTSVLADRISGLEPVAKAVSDIRVRLTELQALARARQDLERRTADSVRRLESVMAGTQSKGLAGENILQDMLSALPPEWQVRNFRVGNKVVEFGLRLPSNLILPIDSKWPATGLLEQFAASDDPREQRRLRMRIESAALEKAKEVRKYVDPNVTLGFGIAAVPDAVYHLCSGAQADLFKHNVVLLGYGMLMPYLLLVFQTELRASQTIDMKKLGACLQNAQEGIIALQGELEGRFSRSIRMLANSREEMSAHLSRITGNLTSLQVRAATSVSAPPLESEQPADGELASPQASRL